MKEFDAARRRKYRARAASSDEPVPTRPPDRMDSSIRPAENAIRAAGCNLFAPRV